MDEMGILPEFKGIAIHDRYANYFGYNCEHGLCNAHLLRDLRRLLNKTTTTGRANSSNCSKTSIKR
ncbi:MAG: transposase [Lewinellaceae bacterium]|nr:transposase [Lewinellaceae bacterium]